MALVCASATCGRPRSEHSETAPHGIDDVGNPCVGYIPESPCGFCDTDLELHDVAAPHPREASECEAADPQEFEGFEGGGGSGGGGGASGGW